MRMLLYKCWIAVLILAGTATGQVWYDDRLWHRWYGRHQFWGDTTQTKNVRPDSASKRVVGTSTMPFLHIFGDTLHGYLASSGGSTYRADSLGSLASLMRLYFLASGWPVVDSAGARVDSLAGRKWVRAGYLPLHAKADSVLKLKYNTANQSIDIGEGRGDTLANVTAVGYKAAVDNTKGSVSAFGDYAGYNNTGSNQSAFGTYTGQSNTGSNQSAFGYAAGYSNTGAKQSAFGTYAGQSNTGAQQSAFGYAAGYQSTDTNQVAMGFEAGRNDSANNCVFIGYQAGKSNLTANQFSLKQGSVNATPLIQGDFLTGTVWFPTRCSTAQTNVADTTITRKKAIVVGTVNPADTFSFTNSMGKGDSFTLHYLKMGSKAGMDSARGLVFARVDSADTVKAKALKADSGQVGRLVVQRNVGPILTAEALASGNAAELYAPNGMGARITGMVPIGLYAMDDTLIKGWNLFGDSTKSVFRVDSAGNSFWNIVRGAFFLADTSTNSYGHKGTGVIAGDTILGNARQNKYTFYGLAVQGDTFDSWQWPGTDTIVVYRVDVWTITPPACMFCTDYDTLVLKGSDSLFIPLAYEEKRTVWTGRKLFKAGVNTSWVCRYVQGTGAADVNITIWYYPHSHGPGGAAWKGLASVIHPALGYALAILALGGAALAKLKKRKNETTDDSGPLNA